MSNKVEIAGQTFSFVGTFIASTHEQLETRIRAQGGEVVASPTPQTDYIVTGANPVGTKFNKVLALGVPMLGEQDIEDLLAGEDVFLGEDDDHEDANALFGEAREWLHRTEPSAKLWQDLTEVLDRCPVNQQAALVSYIDSFFSAWHADGSMASLIGYPIDLESVRHTRVEDGYWRYGVPGELRVAPEHWVGELMQGKRSPKLRLIRALDLVWSDMNSRDVGAVLAHPDLTCIDTLNLSLSKQLTRQLIRTLCASPTRDKLERLMFGQLHPRNSIWWLEASDAPGALQYLDTSQYSALISFRFLEAPYFQNLTGLSLIGEQMDSMRRSLDHGLEVLDIRGLHLASLRDYLQDSATISELRKLTLRNIKNPEDLLRLLSDDYDGHLETLECSLTAYQRSHMLRQTSKKLQAAICRSPLLESVDRLVLGSLFDVVDLDEIARHQPHLEVVRE